MERKKTKGIKKEREGKTREKAMKTERKTETKNT